MLYQSNLRYRKWIEQIPLIFSVIMDTPYVLSVGISWL